MMQIPNSNQIRQAINQIKANPFQILSPRFGPLQGINLSDPNQIIQGLLNSGRIKQEDLNNVMNTAMQLRSSAFRGLF